MRTIGEIEVDVEEYSDEKFKHRFTTTNDGVSVKFKQNKSQKRTNSVLDRSLEGTSTRTGDANRFDDECAQYDGECDYQILKSFYCLDL